MIKKLPKIMKFFFISTTIPTNACDVMDEIILCNVNVQSLLNKVDEIEVFSKVENVDIICITEHWLKNKNVCDVNIPSYKICSHFSRNVHIHGGSLILCKDFICNIKN